MCNLPAYLEQGYFAHFRIVFGREDALFGVQQTFLGFTHFDTGQISQQVTFLGDFVILLGRNQVLAFQVQQLEIVPVSLPQVAQVRPESLFQFLPFQLCVADGQAGVPFFASAVSVEQVETYGDTSVESPIAPLAGSVLVLFVEGIAVAGALAQVRVVS